jgi:hypothetical protein
MSWIALNFRLHCPSEFEHRHSGTLSDINPRGLDNNLEVSAKVSQHVLGVAQPLFHSKTIINCDNYHTSSKLLENMRLKGTVWRTSKHFPRHVILGVPNKAAATVNNPRGSSTPSRTNGMNEHKGDEENLPTVQAGDSDGNIVKIVSNSDAL